MIRKNVLQSSVFIAIWALQLLLAASALPAYAGNESSLEKAMDELGKPLGSTLAEAGIRKLAVAEFTDLNGYQSALGPFLADELIHRLFAARPGTFDLVDRQQVATAWKSKGPGAAAPDSDLAAIGKSLGVQAIVAGTISDLGDEMKVSVRVISTESARLAAMATTRIPRAGEVEVLLRQKGSSFSEPAPGGRYVENTRAFFKNDFLQVTVESLSLSSKKDWLHLSLSFENLIDEALTLRAPYRGSSLTSHGGDKFWSTSTEGLLAEHWSEQGTTFAPRSRSVVAFTFSAEDLKAESGSYSFSTTLYRLYEESSTNFSVGIPGIQLTVD